MLSCARACQCGAARRNLKASWAPRAGSRPTSEVEAEEPEGPRNEREHARFEAAPRTLNTADGETTLRRVELALHE